MIRTRSAFLSLIAVACFAYLPVLFYPFVHDDIVFVKENPAIRHWDNWPGIFLNRPACYPALTSINTYYRPLLDILYRVEYSLFGTNPMGWHFFNVLLHGINGGLVFYLLVCLGFRGLLPWAGAVIFLIHPVQTEAVTCVSGVSNLCMAFWVLLSVIFYLKDRIILSLVAAALGMLSKEAAMMVVPLILALDWHRERLTVKRAAWVLGLGVIFFYLRGLLTSTQLLHEILSSPGELKLRLLAIGYDVMMYLRLVFFPVGLHYYRSTDFLSVSAWWWGMVLVLVYWLMRFPKTMQLGALWFVAGLLPTLNIVPLVNEYSLILTSEHFLYVPLIGMIILGLELTRRIIWPVSYLRCIFLGLVIMMTGMTVKQNTYWRSEMALFRRMVDFEPGFGRGHLLLAKAYYFSKRYNQANEHFARAYDIMRIYEANAMHEAPKQFYRGFLKEILFDWAHSFEEMGFWSAARDKYIEAIVLDPRDPVLWNNLAVLSLRSNRVEEARQYAAKAAQLRPRP